MEPILDPDLRRKMNEIGRVIGGALPKGAGFALLVFDFGHERGGCMNYISNAESDSMLVAMREFIAHCEGRAFDAPAKPQ